jgi:hypothetical protein
VGIAWETGQVPVTDSEKRREQRPGQHDQVPATQTSGAANKGLSSTTKQLRRTTSGAVGIAWATGPLHKGWATILLNPHVEKRLL